MPVPRDASRPLGVVYTPPAVARAMVHRALAPLLAGRGVDALLALRVCDPAVGEGVFAVAAAQLLDDAVARAGGSRAARRRVIDCIVGVDVDARAVDIARRALRGATGADRDRLAVGDALATDWASTHPAGFDAIVGNPPYVRQEWLAGKAPLRKFASYDGVADLYVYFLELAHRIARPGGRYCFVTPNKWLTAAYAAPLRAFLASEGSVEGVVDLGRVRLFDEDAFPCIVWGTVGIAQTAPILAVRSAAEPADDMLERAVAEATPHPRDSWQRGPWSIDRPDERALIEHLAARWPALGTLVGRPSRGVVTGCNRAFVVDGATRARIVGADPGAAALIRPFVKGRDLRRWRRAAADRHILLVDRGTDLASYPGIAAHLAPFRSQLEPGTPGGRKPGSYRWYELQDPVVPLAASRAPRLLYQDIQTEPACCLAEDGDVPDTTTWILPTDDRVVLAILNSPLYAWYARRRFPPALNGAVRPKLAYMQALPIAQPSAELRDRIEALVERRLAGDAVDEAIAAAVLDAYELDAADRRRVTSP